MIDANKINMDNWPGFKPCRKRPVIVHAVQMQEEFVVKTLEGIMTGHAGDYLMIGVDNEKYPCSRDVFKKTYDVIEKD